MASEIKVNTIKDLGGNTIVSSNGSGTITGLPASAISSGTVATARLGSGTASSSTFLAGDSSYKTVSGTTINNNADNKVITGSGTANTLNGEANLTFNGTILGVGGTGDLGSGVHIKKSDSGSSSVNQYSDNLVIEEGTFCGMSFLTGNSGAAQISFGDNNDDDVGIIAYDHNNNFMNFNVNAAERMRIQASGNVSIGNTGDNQKLFVYGSHVSENGLVKVQTSNGSGNNDLLIFYDGNGTECGTISLDAGGNSVAYNTSSDYRLKENTENLTDGITRLKQLKPYKFNWKSKPDGNKVDGFYAHEVSSIVPESILGDKDAMHPEVLYKDEVLYTAKDDLPEGISIGDVKHSIGDVKEATRIKHQKIDQSKLVPLLTSALQEAITKIETLEARVQTLENA